MNMLMAILMNMGLIQWLAYTMLWLPATQICTSFFFSVGDICFSFGNVLPHKSVVTSTKQLFDKFAAKHLLLLLLPWHSFQFFRMELFLAAVYPMLVKAVTPHQEAAALFDTACLLANYGRVDSIYGSLDTVTECRIRLRNQQT